MFANGYLLLTSSSLVNTEILLFLEVLSKHIYNEYKFNVLKFEFNLNDNTYSMDKITAREMEIIRLIYRGESDEKISNTLHISLSTFKKHVNNIYKKMNINNRTGLCTNFSNYIIENIIKN